MDERRKKLDSWDELIAKATRAEAKASLQLSFTIRDIDQSCHRRNRPVHTKSSHTRDEQPNKAQISPSKAGQTPAPKIFQSLNNSSRSKNTTKASKNKNRKDKKHHCCQDQAQKEANCDTPATGVNATAEPKRDVFGVVCYNCNKKGHYSWNCAKPKKDNSSKNS